MGVYFYLACFDVQDDKLRRKVVKALLRHGYRIQGSVFELSLSSQELHKLTVELRNYCHDFDDPANIRFYRQSRKDLVHAVALNEAKIMDFLAYKVL